jgi:hypothetical protein
MTKKRDDDFETARIIEPAPKQVEEPADIEVDLEVEDADDSPSVMDSINSADETTIIEDQNAREAEHAVNSSDQGGDTTGQDKVTVFQEVSYPLGLNEKTFWESPWSLMQKGTFKGVYQQSLEEAEQTMKGVFYLGLSHLLLFAGYFYAAFFFDNDEKKMASKNPYKDVSVNELARKLGGIWTRQLVTDCLKAAFVDMQLRNNDHHFGNLTVDHLRQLARLKNQKDRLKFAKEADQERLNPGDLKERIDLKLGKKVSSSDDKRMIQSMAKPFKDLNRILKDPQVIEILADKDRLGAALTTQEAGELLENCKNFSEKLPNSEAVGTLTKTLVDVQFEKLSSIKLD